MKALPVQRTSVIEHLQAMPDVFDLGLFLLTTGVSRGSAKVMISRWASKGYVELAGPKAGLYLKRLGATMDRSQQIEAAVLHLYPSATICGATILHQAGWTTQIPRELHVAIEERPSVTQLTGVTLFQRPLSWFRTVHDHKGFDVDDRASLLSLRMLQPHWALADMMKHRDGWVPDEDDLDIPDQKAENAVELAKQALMGPLPVSKTRARPRMR
ncbi:hypothetical protein [Hydrogenophaga sp. 2FB]|uniref:hypothetical protein n=1 Tax=Hydrogenophaga sp. 2FB TaxID=2502187 RepID=UPI0010F7143C|nr:hypothetical protein [Hydrogenophaga sp. 2FB]